MVSTARPNAAPPLIPLEQDESALDRAIESAWKVVAPLWTLRNFVAVNAFGGFVDRPFPEAAREVERLFHAHAVMPIEHHRERYVAQEISDSDLVGAEHEMADLRRASGESPKDRARVRTYAEAYDARMGTSWSTFLVNELAKWCAARFDTGQALWKLPWAELGIWAAWRETASIDLSPDLAGLTGFRDYVRRLPEAPHEAIRRVLVDLEVPPEAWPDFMARALVSARGWAGHVRYRVREAGMQGRDLGHEEVELLAVRLAYEGGLRSALQREEGAPGYPRLMAEGFDAPVEEAELHAALIWQHASERGYRRRLLGRLKGGPHSEVKAAPLALQAAFCIDVRSEIFRRHLESLSNEIQTIGFAGFFGFPIEWVGLGDELGTSRCPVLLSPGFRIRETAAKDAQLSHAEALAIHDDEVSSHRAFLSARLSSVSAFTLAETVGTWFGLRILTDSVQATHPRADGAFFGSKLEGRLGATLEPESTGELRTGLTASERVALAEGALRNMGLVSGFADIVLLAGHGSRTVNNPYGSGLDCGACGGHTGEANARIAAAVLNDPEVRAQLRQRGIDIPQGTRFIAGLHETTTDEVRLFDIEGVDPARLEAVRAWLREAGARTRQERLHGLTRGLTDGVNAEDEVKRRSRDWSEVRPEWGLAKNAAFIAARRSRTRGIDLGGRTFLHDYDVRKDPERKTLELIMVAPMVVANWINMQYYASTVDNEILGSGNKVLHNVVGRHGVMLGNRGDLQVGLPLQSVHDGEQIYHEPLRLSVIIEASREDIDEVIARHEQVRQLVDHGWLHLLSWDPDGDAFYRRRPGGLWVEEA